MIEQLKQEIGAEVQENVILARFSTFKIGGPAKYFIEVENKEKLHKILQVVVNLNLPYFFLGGGSNVLISDKGFDGLVIKLLPGKIAIQGNRVVTFAGSVYSEVIKKTVHAGLEGLVPCGNIPGSVGGAVRGNAGAYGVNTGDFVEQVEALEIRDYEIGLKVLLKDDCRFQYRESIFKQESNLVICEVTFNLLTARKTKEELIAEIEAEQKSRWKKHPMDYPSTGCSFKNILYTDELVKFKDWVNHDKIPVGKFIEMAGLKGEKIGGAQVSEKHGNYIINVNNATADDVVQLISLIKMKVRDQFGVQLAEEVQYVGFD